MLTLLNEVYLDFDDLKSIGVDENTVWKGVSRKSKIWKVIKDPSDGRKRLVVYSTMSDKYKEAVRFDLCGGFEPDEWLEMQKQLAKQSEQLTKRAGLLDKVEEVCEDGYKKYTYLYTGATPKQVRCLCRAAGVVEVLAAWYRAHKIPFKSSEPVIQVAEWLKANEAEYFYLKYIPMHPTKLKEKVKEYNDGKPLKEIITLPRKGNDNRITHKGEMWWQSTAVSLSSSGRNMTQSAIVRKLRELAAIMGNEAPSETTVRNFLSEKDFLTATKRMDLNNRHMQRHRASMPIADAMFPGSCWEMDGTRVQLAPHSTKDGLKFLNVVVVRDVYSGAYLGWHFDLHENGFAYRMALKMAVNITGRLPYELRHDEFPGLTSPECKHLFGKRDKKGRVIVESELEKMGVKLTLTSSAVGKARAERGFYTLQQVFESQHLAYWGQGIRSSTASAHPTEDYRYKVSRELKNAGWDFDAAWMAECGVIAAYNHTPLSVYSRKHATLNQSPWELYQNAEDEAEGRRMEVYEIADLFWATREVGIRQRCIVMEFRPNKYRYDLNEYEHYEILAKYQKKGVQLTVKYDPCDLNQIMLFDDQGNFLAEVAQQGKIQLYGSAAEWDKAAQWKEKSNAIDARRKSDLNEYLEQLPAEAALLMPTKLSKQVSEDAQTAYLLGNDEWKTGRQPKQQVVKQQKVSNTLNIDPEEYARSQYSGS